MRWPGNIRHDPRSIIDNYRLYELAISHNRVKMQGEGTPGTYYSNTSIDEFGVFNTSAVKCYCYNSSANAQPNPRHYLCMGTGVLSGYQKYGYMEHVFAMPSAAVGDLTVPTSLVTFTSSSNDIGYQISSTDLSVDILSKAIPVSNLLAADRFIVQDTCDIANNKVEYYYSTDNINWTLLVLDTYTRSKLGNKYATNFVLSPGTTNVWLRIRLRKRSATAASPVWYSVRFRYRQMRTLVDIYPRHKIQEPAFLVSRSQNITTIKNGQDGVILSNDQKFWVLPEVNIKNVDVIEYYNGPWAHRKFVVENMERHLHGPEQIEISKFFNSKVIRDNTDLNGIISYLY